MPLQAICEQCQARSPVVATLEQAEQWMVEHAVGHGNVEETRGAIRRAVEIQERNKP